MGYSYYDQLEEWNKVDAAHHKEQLGKLYQVNHCTWEPRKKYNGQTGAVMDTMISKMDSDVRYVILTIGKEVLYELKDLKEIQV